MKRKILCLLGFHEWIPVKEYGGTPGLVMAPLTSRGRLLDPDEPICKYCGRLFRR